MKANVDRWGIWDKRVRDFGVWTMGLAAFAHEVFLEREPRPAILVAIGYALGFPLARRADEKRKDNG